MAVADQGGVLGWPRKLKTGGEKEKKKKKKEKKRKKKMSNVTESAMSLTVTSG